VKFGSKSVVGVLALGTILAVPAVANAGASHIAYQQKKAEMEAQARQAAGKTTIIDVIRQQGQFETFLKAVEAAGMTDTLKQAGAVYTVFAPTDDAFAKIPAEQLQALLKDRTQLRQVIGYHILPQKKYDWEMRRDAVRTLDGRTLQIAQYTAPDDIRLNDTVEVVESNLKASNGVVHAIDEVLMPRG
jgi:uncharacterized surface protein with fasciclin (FAS1) repeats